MDSTLHHDLHGDLLIGDLFVAKSVARLSLVSRLAVSSHCHSSTCTVSKQGSRSNTCTGTDSKHRSTAAGGENEFSKNRRCSSSHERMTKKLARCWIWFAEVMARIAGMKAINADANSTSNHGELAAHRIVHSLRDTSPLGLVLGTSMLSSGLLGQTGLVSDLPRSLGIPLLRLSRSHNLQSKKVR